MNANPYLKPALPVQIGSYSGTLHIHHDERGVAWIDDSNIKVVEVILDHVQGQSPEQMHADYPHLSLAQIYAAIAYYYDHQQEIDILMQQWQTRYEAEYAKSDNQAWHEQIRSRAVGKHSAFKEEVAA
jgi:uncharacterized protein (DUF433 family)